MSSDPAERSLAARVVRGGAAVAFGSYASIIAGFAANLLMTRALAPEQFGVFVAATFFYGLLNLRTKAGLAPAFARRKDDSGELIGTFLGLELGAGLATLGIALLAMPLLLIFGYNEDMTFVIVALALIGVVESLHTIPAVMLEKGLKFGWTSTLSALSLLISYVPAIAAAYMGAGYWSIVIQCGVQAIILLGGSWWIARRCLVAPWATPWRFSWPIARQLLRFGVVWGFSYLGALIASQFDNYLIATFVSLETLGYYDRAFRIAMWPNLLVTSVIARTAFMAYAKLQDDPVRLAKTLSMTVWMITSTALPMALAIFAAAPDLVALLYGESWLPVVPLLRCLVAFSLVRPLIEDISGVLNARGRPHYVSATSWLTALLAIAVATPLTLTYQAEGTAIGVGLAMAAGCAVSYVLVRRGLEISFLKLLGTPALAVACSLVVYLLVGRWLEWNSLPILLRLFCKAGVAVAVFYAVLLLLQRQQFVSRISYVWRLALHTQ